MNLFADDPAEYFGHSGTAAHHMPRADQEALQLETVRERFAEMRDLIPPLKALADAQKIERIDTLADVAPLLFPHTFCKSYPENLLERGDFPAMTRWLQSQTRIDLSPVADRHFPTIDAWFDALETETPTDMMHSSGTTGRLSFYPRSKGEGTIHRKFWKMLTPEWVEPLEFDYSEFTFAIVWPSYAKGRSAVLKLGELCRDVFAPSPEDFYPLIPFTFSADWQYWLMRSDKARKTGDFAPTPSDYVAARMEESNEIHRTHRERTHALLEIVRDRLANRRAMLTGGVHGVHRFAADGLAYGMEAALGRGSAVRVVGGLKGIPAADDMIGTILRFSGAPQLIDSYGMSELGIGFSMCRHRRYHIHPWIIPFVLDAESGALLPREGRQKGRAAFMDIPARSFWGGIISGDLVEIDWAPCPCGRTTPHLHETIDRLPSQEADDHAMGPAPAEAVAAAIRAMVG